MPRGFGWRPAARDGGGSCRRPLRHTERRIRCKSHVPAERRAASLRQVTRPGGRERCDPGRRRRCARRRPPADHTQLLLAVVITGSADAPYERDRRTVGRPAGVRVPTTLSRFRRSGKRASIAAVEVRDLKPSPNTLARVLELVDDLAGWHRYGLKGRCSRRGRAWKRRQCGEHERTNRRPRSHCGGPYV